MPVDLTGAANADWAAQALARLEERAPEAVELLAGDDDMAHRYAVLTGASTAFGELIAGHPDLLQTLERPPEPWSREVVAREGEARLDHVEGDRRGAKAAEVLAGLQREGLLRIAARDLLGLVDTREAAHELADLADGLVRAAHRVVAEDEPSAELVVLGMGKLGGQELNYVSDIDVMFVHDGEAAAAERMARAIMFLLGSHTPRGAAYEVDANLRPEGRNGALSRTVPSYTAYYDKWAQTWEQQALLKVRPLAGPPRLGLAFSRMTVPYLWPESLGADAVTDIQAMKRRVEQSKPVTRDGDRHLKLAPGGLRDIEFSVQLLQLVHGPADPTLRERGTLPALDALATGGYVDEGDAALFGDAYQFLRTVEHRLQMRALRRTHTVPEQPEDIQRLARAMGFRDLPVRTAREEFTAEMARVRAGVRRLHQQLFYRPLLSTIAAYGPDDRLGMSGGLGREAGEARLRALGFDRASRAREHLEAMTRGSDRAVRQLRVILPAMLERLADTPDPDGGLAALRQLSDRLRTNPGFMRLIRDNPPGARTLAQVLGASPRMGRWFARQPEMLALLDDEDALAEPRAAEDLRELAAGLVRRGGGAVGGDPLRRLKRRESLRTAVRDLLGLADVRQTARELTWLGEALLEAAVTTVAGDQVRLAVIGLGRFGAGELSYSSDLDVVFVHDGDVVAARQVAEDVLAYLGGIIPEGSTFRLDPGLRPEGRGGPLTRTLDSYAQYYQRWGQPWEFLALTQARPVAGDQELGEAFMSLVRPLVHPEQVPEERVVAIRQMKARVERERAGRRGVQPLQARAMGPGGPRAVGRRAGGPRPGAGPGLRQRAADGGGDLKLGPGGLSDVEWTVQLMTMVGGGTDEELRGPGTLDGLARLAAAGHLSAEETAWLESGWTLLSRVRNGLYLIGERDTASLPRNPETLRRLALLMHHANDQSLVEEVDRARRRIRKVFDRRFFA